MRTRLAALFAGLAALILAFGAIGSAAWFTGQDTIPVTGTTGKIVFQTNGPNTAGITLSNLLPGAWTPQYYVEVYNTSESTTAVKYRITDAFKSESVAGLFDKVNVRVRHTFCGTGTPGAWPVVYTGPIGDLAVNSVDNAITTARRQHQPLYWFDFQLTARWQAFQTRRRHSSWSSTDPAENPAGASDARQRVLGRTGPRCVRTLTGELRCTSHGSIDVRGPTQSGCFGFE